VNHFQSRDDLFILMEMVTTLLGESAGSYYYRQMNYKITWLGRNSVWNP
jgi:hypothetical protein